MSDDETEKLTDSDLSKSQKPATLHDPPQKTSKSEKKSQWHMFQFAA